MKTSVEIAEMLVSRIIKDLALSSGAEVAVLVNGLGATSREELYILYNDVKKQLDGKGIKAAKVYVDEFATSMEMQGASVTLMLLDDELKALLGKPASTPFVKL